MKKATNQTRRRDSQQKRVPPVPNHPQNHPIEHLADSPDKSEENYRVLPIPLSADLWDVDEADYLHSWQPEACEAHADLPVGESVHKTADCYWDEGEGCGGDQTKSSALEVADDREEEPAQNLWAEEDLVGDVDATGALAEETEFFYECVVSDQGDDWVGGFRAGCFEIAVGYDPSVLVCALGWVSLVKVERPAHCEEGVDCPWREG